MEWSADDLRIDAAWVRRFAGALVREPAAADDLAQDTWLAALERPRSETPLRPWLVAVMRNLARLRHRASQRAEQRLLAERQELHEIFSMQLPVPQGEQIFMGAA